MCRNYMENIAGSIEEWTTEQEAKYQATLLAQEVKTLAKEADAVETAANTRKHDAYGV